MAACLPELSRGLGVHPGLKRVVPLTVVCLAACTTAPVPRTAPGSAFAVTRPADGSGTTAPSDPSDPDADSEAFRAPIPIEGCTAENVSELRSTLNALDERIGYRQTEPPESIVADIARVWSHPCLSHVARFFRAPQISDPARLGEVWRRGMGASLRAMAGALYRREGRRYVVVPPDAPAPISEAERQRAAAWICPDGSDACGHAGSYVARAHAAFDGAELLAHRWNGPLVGSDGDDPMPNAFVGARMGCEQVRQSDEERAKRTPFETFVMCVASSSPRTWRYPDAQRMRARHRGWLVLRGRRGHYAFSDEVGAYDLATGAAYVARSASALVLAGPGVDFDAVDKQRRQEVVTGRVAVDQVRELAFLLATAPLLRAQRTKVQIVPVPEGLEPALTPGRGAQRPFDVQEAWWRTSAQTSIAWQIIDGNTTIAEGDLTWPDSYKAWEMHAGELVRVMEAGLSEGCPPARLPKGVVAGRAGVVHRLDADPDAQIDVFASLGKMLEGVAVSCTKPPLTSP